MATVRDYFLSHEGGLSISTAVMGFAVMAGIGFFGLASRRVGEDAADGGLARSAFVVAASVVVSTTILGVVLQAALVQQIAPAGDDSTLLAAYAVWDRVFHTAPTPGTNLGPLGLVAFALSNLWIVATSVRVLTGRA